MKKRELTCIICPRGCSLSVLLDEEGGVKEVSGNFCPRGVKYAENECVNPVRTVTTTVRCKDGKVRSVKTDRAVPKSKVFEVMSEINRTLYSGEIKIGAVVICSVAGEAANVVLTDE